MANPLTPPTPKQPAGKVASSGGGDLSTSSSAILLTTLRAVTTVDGGAGTSSLQAVPEGGPAVRTVPSSIVLDPSTPVLILTEAEVPCPQLAVRTQHHQQQQQAPAGAVGARSARDITSSSVMTEQDVTAVSLPASCKIASCNTATLHRAKFRKA
uniref:Uncharacterized protein n=1 Tax=Anopheles merus TaxID=30066 RepID=A0A182VCN3_ANOME